jgi:hypothetical protein
MRKEDVSQQEYVGTIESITQLEQTPQKRIIMRAPAMQWLGSARFFFRVVTPLGAGAGAGAGAPEAGAGGAQTSNILDPACHFSEKSPVISVEITTVVGSDALVRPLANADNSAGYDLTRWKAELSRLLNMPTPGLFCLYPRSLLPPY